MSISFWIENNTSARPTRVLTDEEYEEYDPINETWFRVTVRTEDDKKDYINMHNYIQRSKWTPNQIDRGEDDEDLENKLLEEMKKLER